MPTQPSQQLGMLLATNRYSTTRSTPVIWKRVGRPSGRGAPAHQQQPSGRSIRRPISRLGRGVLASWPD
eukprot:9101716-Alexandrium_andersonii.AAC.1